MSRNIIKPRRGSTIPTTNDLEIGEFSIDHENQIIYGRGDDGVIRVLASAGGSNMKNFKVAIAKENDESVSLGLLKSESWIPQGTKINYRNSDTTYNLFERKVPEAEKWYRIAVIENGTANSRGNIKITGGGGYYINAPAGIADLSVRMSNSDGGDSTNRVRIDGFSLNTVFLDIGTERLSETVYNIWIKLPSNSSTLVEITAMESLKLKAHTSVGSATQPANFHSHFQNIKKI